MSTRAVTLMETLGLSEDELCAALDTDALTLLSGQVEHASELKIILDLLEEPAENVGSPTLRRWVRANGPYGKPIDLLTGRNFPAFEDALDDLNQRGFRLRADPA